jgi:hypothetical protein
MVVRKLLLFTFLFFLLLEGSASKDFKSLKPFNSEFIVGDVDVCYNRETRYRTSLRPNSPDACDYYYIWEITGGVFSNGDTTILEQGTDAVDVTWLKGKNLYKLEVIATYRILPANPDMSCEFESTFEEEGFLIPSFTGDAFENPSVSNWTFNSVSADTTSFICSDSEIISINEFKGENPNGYDIETKLSYYNDVGEKVIIKDWGKSKASNQSVEFNYESLHKQVTFLSESRYSNCLGVRNSEEIVIDFYVKPKIKSIETSEPHCKGGSGSATIALSNAKLSSVIIGLTDPDGEFISFQTDADNDSVFTLNNSIKLREYVPDTGGYAETNIELSSGDYTITIEPQIFKDSSDTNFPCFVERSFNIGDAPTDFIFKNTPSDAIKLDCSNDDASISFQMKRENVGGAKFDYRLYNSDDNTVLDSLNNTSAEVSFQVGEGEYYIKGKETDCSWGTEAVLESFTVRVVSHSISFDQGPEANELKDNGFHLVCYGDSTASISVKAKDALAGNLDYLLKKENDGSWNDYDTLINKPSNTQVEFQNLPEGNYKVRVKFSGCADWTVRDDEVIESKKSIEIKAPKPITIDTSQTKNNNPPKCKDGDDGFIVFSANGGNGSLKIIKVTINDIELDTNNYSFQDLKIPDLSGGDVITSITIMDAKECTEEFDNFTYTIPKAKNPFQFTKQTPKDPKCYNSDGTFEFSYKDANVQDSDISKFVVLAGDPCIDDKNCNTDDDISDSPQDIYLDISNNSLIVSATEIANNKTYQIYLDDGQCKIVSDPISFTEKAQPEFLSTKSPFQISCKGKSIDVTLDMEHTQGLFKDFDLIIERKPSGKSKYTKANLDTINISRTSDNELIIQDLYEGDYKIYGTDGNECSFKEHQFMLEEPAIALNINAYQDTLFTDNDGKVYHISKYDAEDGKIEFEASGGEEPYTFMLFANGNLEGTKNTGGTTGLFDSLNAKDKDGNLIKYYVRVIDSRSCPVNSDTLTLNEPDSLSFEFSLNEYVDTNNNTFNIKCNGGTDTIRVETEGGVYPHLVEISIGNSLVKSDTLNTETEVAVFSDLTQATYKIEVTDKFNIEGVSNSLRTNIEVAPIALIEPDPLNVNTKMTQPICYGDSTGTITVTPSGGAPFEDNKYYITFLNESGGVILDSISSEIKFQNYEGNYYYTVTDEFGCEYRPDDYGEYGHPISITELNPRLTVAEDTVSYPPCAGDETATLSVNASGGRSVGSYILELYDNNDPPLYGLSPLIDSVSTDDSGNFTFDNLFAGEYIVWAYDDSLCAEMIDITIEEREYPLEFISVDSVLSRCANSSDAQLKIISTGGDSPHNFSLNNTDFSPYDSITYSDDSAEMYYHKTFTDLIGDSTYNIYLKDVNYYNDSYNDVCLIETSQIIPKTPSLALDFKKTDIQCFGKENGVLELKPTYGDNINPLNFDIEINGPNGLVDHVQGYADSLSAGSYNVKITLKDTTACQTPLFKTINISQPSTPLNVDIFSSTAFNCSTIEDVILKGEISGGLSTSNYFYAINSDNTADFDTLKVSDGEFRVIRKLKPGWNTFNLKSSPYSCLASDSFFIESVKPTLKLIQNKFASCKGKSDGELVVTSDFEKLNFKLMNLKDTFSVEDADSVIFSGLRAGYYQLTGSSASCFADTMEINIGQPDSLIFNPEIIEKPSCNQANGIGSLNISGGTSPYEIFWQLENGNILDSTSLKSGYYDIIVEDANNCSAILNDFYLEESNDFMVAIDNLSNPSCGKDNGSISIETNGGVPPYEINWFNNGTQLLQDTDSITGLSEGNYIYSVTDAQGCIFEDSVELNGYEPIVVNILDETPADCDTQNGSITLAVSGGAPPYTYSWPDSIPFAESNYAEGLLGGKIYTVSVSDANLCTMEYEFAIENIGAPEIVVKKTYPKCGLANGSIEIELLSESNASYKWKGFESTGSTLENIPSDIYFVTVTTNNCPLTKKIKLTDDLNNPLNVNPILTNAGCNDTDGEIELDILGGTPPYTISWDNSPLNDGIRKDLSSGNYSFVVTDSVGCSVSKDIYLEKKELPQLSLNSLRNSECGEANGFIRLDSISSEYTFNWSHTDTLNHHLAENLSSGLYSVYATNEIGCSTDTVSYYISSNNTDLKIQEISVSSASCNESEDGSIEVNAINGTAPFQYEWNDEDQQTGQIAEDLRPGTYTVRVTDATNCSKVKSITLGHVNPVYISSISKIAPSCQDATDGSISVSAAGGKGNYTYEWSTGDTTQTITGLKGGTYSVTVYDNSICSDQANITITAPDTLFVEYSTEKPKCYAAADGQVALTISGGVPPYVIEWEDGSSLKNRFDLTTGNYNVFISDNNNCSISKNVVVSPKDSVTIEYDIEKVSCYGRSDGEITIDSIQNAKNPMVKWSNGQIGNTLRNVSAGFYEAVIIDSYGCSTNFDFEVGSPDSMQIVNDTIKDVLCNNGFNGSISFDVIGGSGNYSFDWDDGPRIKNRDKLFAGNYRVTVTDENNCTLEKQFTIEEPNGLTLEYTADSVSCFGNADGFASIEIEGGMPPYRVSWSDGATDSVRNDLSAGTHNVLVTDANNCSKSKEIFISNRNPIRIDNIIKTIPSCYKGSDGGIEIEIIGGKPPYSVSWENEETGNIIENIPAGNYKVTITDENNCQLSELIGLGDGTPIYLTSVITANPICYGEPSGMIEVKPDGGNPPFEVVWEDGASGFKREDLLAGSHMFEVVDSTGCSVSYEISLQDPPLEEIDHLPSEVFLCTGGVANLDAGEWNSYEWTSDNGFSSIEREVSIDAEGDYNLTVTNQAGCEDQHQFKVIKDDNILTADFLLTSEAVALDTVIIVDVSWRVPDSVRWINPDDPDFYLVSQTEEYQEVIFTRTGEFELKMKAKLDFCEADVSKTITVLSRKEAARLANKESNFNSNELHVSTSIYPNPNFGDFRIEMKGNMEYDHNSKIIDVNSGIEYYQFHGKKQKNYVFNVGDNRLPDGVYMLIMETESETITKRFIVK